MSSGPSALKVSASYVADGETVERVGDLETLVVIHRQRPKRSPAEVRPCRNAAHGTAGRPSAAAPPRRRGSRDIRRPPATGRRDRSAADDRALQIVVAVDTETRARRSASRCAVSPMLAVTPFIAICTRPGAASSAARASRVERGDAEELASLRDRAAAYAPERPRSVGCGACFSRSFRLARNRPRCGMPCTCFNGSVFMSTPAYRPPARRGGVRANPIAPSAQPPSGPEWRARSRSRRDRSSVYGR